MAFSKAHQYVTPFEINHLVAKYCKALSYPARIIIVRWLAAEGPKHAGEISAYIELSPSTTSHHLSCLEQAGFITGFERGPHILYRYNEQFVQTIRGFIDVIFDELEGRVEGNAEEGS